MAGLYAYGSTLAPTVLEGDAALFQFTPYVLGVTYPTGFPLYLLLGHGWLILFPFGELAWRMNLFSALCASAALPLFYHATRRLLDNRLAGLTAGLIFATLPTFWRWSTVAKTYSLNILLLSCILYLLARASERSTTESEPPKFWNPLTLTAGLLGLSISVHNTMLLLLPGWLLWSWLHLRPLVRRPKILLMAVILLGLPNLLYLYIPLRAEWLIAEYGRATAIQTGLVADFYHSGWPGLIRYFTAAEFTQGVATDWDDVPGRFWPIYVTNLLLDEVGWLGRGLGLIGGLTFAVRRPRIFGPLFLIYGLPIPFVLAYGRGQQSAFLLPSFLMFTIFAGYTIELVARLTTWLKHRFQIRQRLLDFLPVACFLLLIPTYFLPRVEYNFNWLDNKWNRAIYEAWVDTLQHPLEPQAGLLAEWADLTSGWYLQHIEHRRPDLHGIYPPTETVVLNYLQSGRPLYIAGLLDMSQPERQWIRGLEERYQLIPWGRLVRIAPLEMAPQSLLPELPHHIEATFADKLHLLQVDYPAQAIGGQDYGVTLTWQALTDLPPETTISLRLTQGDNIIAQLDDTLLSGWFPRENLPAGQYVLSYAPIPIPRGTLPGRYRLQLVVYTHHSQPWPMADGSGQLDLGEVDLISPVASPPVLTNHDFNGELVLQEAYYSASRVGQGKGFAVNLLWQTRQQPADNYTLLVDVVDEAGNRLRRVEHQPPLPTGQWQTGQYIRDLVNVVLPASTPPGETAVHVQLSWQRPDGSTLAVRRWTLPLGDTLALDSLAVVEKEDRLFEPPPIAHPLTINFADKARLLGYQVETGSVRQSKIRLSTATCQPNCQVALTLYWQGVSEMAALYSVFLHLVNQEGELVAQQDKLPGLREKQPTTGWLPGEVVIDPITLPLPPDLPPGQYRLRLGLYEPLTGHRLPVFDEAGQVSGDFIELAPVSVVE